VIKAPQTALHRQAHGGSLKDALEIFRLAKQAGVPVFSASSLRYGKTTQAVRNGSIGKVLRAETSSPVTWKKPIRPFLVRHSRRRIAFHRDGHGLRQRQARHDQRRTDRVTGTWKGGRLGVYRENPKGYDGTAKGEKGKARSALTTVTIRSSPKR